MSRQVYKLDRTGEEAEVMLVTFIEGVERLAKKLGVDTYAMSAHAPYVNDGRLTYGTISQAKGDCGMVLNSLSRLARKIDQDDEAPTQPTGG